MNESTLSKKDVEVLEQEKAMQNDQRLFSLFIQQTPMGVIQWSTEHKIIVWNQASERIFGYSRQEALGRYAEELIVPESIKSQYNQIWKEMLERKRSTTYAIDSVTKDGRIITCEWCNTPLLDDDGSLVGVASFVQNISERKREEEALKVSEEKYRLLIENASEAIWEEDFSQVKNAIDELKSHGVKDFRQYFEENPDFVAQTAQKIRILDVNPQCLKMFKARNKEELLDSFDRILVPETLQIVKEEFIAIAEGKRYLQGETVNRTLKGELLQVLLSMSLPEPGSSYSSVLVILLDITQRKKVEKAIAEQSTFLQQVIDADPNFIFVKDRDSRFVLVNQALAEAYGSTPQELIGKSDADFNPNVEEVEHFHQDDLEVIDGQQEKFIPEEPITWADGSLHWLQTVKRPLIDEDGTSRRLLGVATYITERKRAEEAIVSQRAFLQQVIDADPNFIFVKDRDSRFVLVNQALAEAYGSTPQELIGKSDADFNPNVEEVEHFHQDDLEVIDGQQEKFIPEEPITWADGSLHWLQTVKRPLIDEDGTSRRLLGVATYITERKRLENQIRESLDRRGYQVQMSTQIAQDIAAATDLDELFQRVVTSVKERFGYYHTQLLRYDPHVDAVILVTGYGETGSKMLAMGHKMPMGVGLIGTAAATGETVLRPMLENDPDWQPNPLLPETRGEIAVPIKLADQVLGVLDVQSDKAGALSEEDQLLLEGLCGQIAVAIEDTRLRQEMENRLQELDTLYRATSQEGWRLFRDTSQMTQGYIYDSLAIRPAETLWLPELQTAIGEAIISTHAYDQPQGDGKSTIASPLAVRGEVVGVLGVYDDPQKPLTEDEIGLIEQVSEQVAQALETARLFEQTQRSLADTQAMYTGSARVIGASSVEEILVALVESTPLSQLDHATLLFFDHPWDEEPPETMVVGAEWNKPDSMLSEPTGTMYSFKQYPLAGLFYREKPFIAGNILTDDRFNEEMRTTISGSGIRGGVIFPLIAVDQWFGVVGGQSLMDLNLTDDDIMHISSLVNQASTVIQSLRLQQEMRDRLQELTTLQRLMSREAWVAYQSQATAPKGYFFDRLNVLSAMDHLIGESTSFPEIPGGGHLDGAQFAPSSTRSVEAILSVRDEPIGILGVQPEEGHLLSPQEEEFLRAVSEQVAQALERARLIEQTHKSAVELQAVAEVGTATATILEPEPLLQQVVDLTKERFGLYHAHIYLLDEIGANLHIAAGAGEIGRSMVSKGWNIPIDKEESLVARAGRTREGFIISDVSKEEGYLPNPLLPDTRSELAVPMVIADQLLGVFDVQSDFLGRFTEEDIRTFSTLAAQVAVALQNARLYAEQLSTVERLRELDNMKSAFLANMSHELRTPLNSILGFTQVVIEGLDGPLTEAMISDLELIEKNGKHLLDMINDVLDMAKIEAGRLSLNLEPVNLYDLLEDVIVTSGPLIREKNLDVHLDANANDNWIVTADHVRIRQIFINLMGNSIKFTESGGIGIEMGRIGASTEIEADMVQVRIRDTGIGIPKNKLEEIFEAFSQVDTTTTRKAGGTGLGLPISRRLVELHGGRLWADSEGPGKGSTFFLELPVSVHRAVTAQE